MYQILIVDDEREERNVIRFLLDKYNFPLQIQEAANGKEALSRLEGFPFDILFTDIKMPFLSGIDLASIARQLYPGIHIIFFSGFDDFDYAKEALSLRVVNYILKPVNPEEFQKTIASVIASIRTARLEKVQQMAALSFMKNHILYQLINNTPVGTLKRMYPAADFTFAYGYHRLFLIQFDIDFFDFSLEKTVASFPQDCDFINLNPSQSLLLFYGAELPFSLYRKEAELLHHAIHSAYGVDIYISVSNSFSGPENIASAYEEAEQFLENRFFFRNQSVFSYTNSTDEADTAQEEDDAVLACIEKDIQLKDSFSLRQHVTLLLLKYENRPVISHIYIRFINTSLLRLLLRYLPNYDELSFDQMAGRIYHFRHFSEISGLIYQILDELVAVLEKEQQTPRHAVHLVEQYIHQHFKEELGLNLLAEKVFLTPRYLSTVFIQEKGYGINKYIKTLRMEKAKDLLLHTNRKISDVCQAVGYTNLSYFCKSFQEYFGATPEKYRQKPGRYGSAHEEN